jgi:hypothetical protein
VLSVASGSFTYCLRYQQLANVFNKEHTMAWKKSSSISRRSSAFTGSSFDTRSTDLSSSRNKTKNIWYSLACKCYKQDLIPVFLAIIFCLACLTVCLVTYFVVEQTEKTQLQVALNDTRNDVMKGKILKKITYIQNSKVR